LDFKGFFGVIRAGDGDFEFWLLLHYKKTDKPFTNFDEIRKDKDFKKHFSNYDKSKNNFNDK
jgi:hypothetical protein